MFEFVKRFPVLIRFTVAPGIVFSSQFLQLSAIIPSNYIYGLGEHATPWRLDMNHSILTLFARDVPPDPVYDVRTIYNAQYCISFKNELVFSLSLSA